MGHVRLAGMLSEQNIAGTAFLRLDIPETDHQPAFTRFFGTSAVYSISPVAEEIARAIAGRSQPQPVERYELPTPDDAAYDEGYD